MAEKETGMQIKTLRLDGGGEYFFNEFSDFLQKHGVRRQFTCKYTLQQNGVAERMNRTILERARSMRVHAGLPLHLWGATVDTVVYLINRSPSSSIEGKIPEEVWSGKSINYSFLRVFGCIAYAHVDREQRKKLDPKSLKCIFLG